MVFRFLSGCININKYSLLKQNQVLKEQTSQEYTIHMLSTLSDYNKAFPAPSSHNPGRMFLRQSIANRGS